jgi:hypothetical protein
VQYGGGGELQAEEVLPAAGPEAGPAREVVAPEQGRRPAQGGRGGGDGRCSGPIRWPKLEEAAALWSRGDGAVEDGHRRSPLYVDDGHRQSGRRRVRGTSGSAGRSAGGRRWPGGARGQRAGGAQIWASTWPGRRRTGASGCKAA